MARAFNIITILVVGLMLAAPRAASGESGTIWDAVDVTALTRQVAELEKQGRYSEAVPLAERALVLQEKLVGPDHADVAGSLINLANLYVAQVATLMPSPCTSTH